MGWFDLLRAHLLRKAEPTWIEVYDPEYTRVRDVLKAKERDHHIWLRIVKHGPDQYSAYYERSAHGGEPLSAEPEWWEKAMPPQEQQS